VGADVLEQRVLLVVQGAALREEQVNLGVLVRRAKDFWGQTPPVELAPLAEAAQVAAVLVRQALQTQTLLEQQEGQDHPQPFPAQVLPMLVVVAAVAVLVLAQVAQEVLAAVAQAGVITLLQLRALQIEAAAVVAEE